MDRKKNSAGNSIFESPGDFKIRHGAVYTPDSGFTLIEILIALTVLAIVSIPLLSYFSDASKINALASNKQKANVAAQTVMEDFKQKDMKTIAEEYRRDPSGNRGQYQDENCTTAYPAAEEFTPNTPADPYYFQYKNYMVGDTPYDIRVKVKEGIYQNEYTSAGAIIAEWNTFVDYDVSSVESNFNAVIEEGINDKNTAIASLYRDCIADPASAITDEDTVKNNLKRNIRIIFNKDSTTGNVTLTAFFEYTVDGAPDTITQRVKRYEKEFVNLKGVYLFYYPLSTSDLSNERDFIQIETNMNKVGSTDPIDITENYDLYLIASNKDQDGNDIDLSTYVLYENDTPVAQVTLGGDVNSKLKNNVYVRGKNTPFEVHPIGVSGRQDDSYYNKLGDHKQRLLEIEVSVYKAGYAGDEDKLIVRMNSAEDD